MRVLKRQRRPQTRRLGAQGGTKGANADQQVLSFSSTDSDGKLQSTSVTLSADNALDVDQAVSAINTALTSGPSRHDFETRLFADLDPKMRAWAI